MASKKDPAYLFYPADFEMGTMGMSYEQKGKYISLLNLQHSKGGYLKEKDIKRVLNRSNDDDIEVLEKFEHNDNGYFNKRLLNEMLKRQSHSKQQSENAYKRWNKEKENNDSMPLQCDGNANAMPLTNTNRNTNKNIIKNSNDLYNTIILYWNENSNLAKVLKLSDARKKLLNARLQDFSEEKIKEMIDIVSKSDFLQGRKNDWKANFDWCFNVNNFIKIIEGNYNNMNNGNKQDSKVIVEPGSQLEKDLQRYEKNKIVIE